MAKPKRSCGVVRIPVGNSNRKRAFNQEFCWGKNGIVSSRGRTTKKVTRNCGRGPGTCKSKPSKTTRKSASRPKRRKISTTRKSTVSRNTAATFVAKASYARTKSGKLRKGCRKVKNVYRCKKTGAARRTR